MYVSIVGYDDCSVYLEKGEHDHQLEWPMPEMEIELSTPDNEILYSKIYVNLTESWSQS